MRIKDRGDLRAIVRMTFLKNSPENERHEVNEFEQETLPSFACTLELAGWLDLKVTSQAIARATYRFWRLRGWRKEKRTHCVSRKIVVTWVCVEKAHEMFQ